MGLLHSLRDFAVKRWSSIAIGAARDRLIALIVMLIAMAFRLPRLSVPTAYVFDEVFHATTALQYLEGQKPLEWVHPPTSKLLIAVPIWIFGYHSWAWRLAPALAGIALAPVFYYFARRVAATERAAVLATILLLCDGVYLVQSRAAMTNIFAVLFQVAAASLVVRAMLRDVLSMADMAEAGVFLGLALSTRWTSLFTWAFLAVVFVLVRGTRCARVRDLVLTVLAFVVIPALVYGFSYVPIERYRGHFRAERWTSVAAAATDVKTAIVDLASETKRVRRYHAKLRAEHPYFSKWYTWPWLYRPTWYYFTEERGEPKTVRGIVALGNPAVWWASIPISAWALAKGFDVRRRGLMPAGVKLTEPRLAFAGVGFWFMYLPWAISPRELNYSHYFFEAIPYACLSLGMWLDRHWNDPTTELVSESDRPILRQIAAAFALLGAVLALLMRTDRWLTLPAPVSHILRSQWLTALTVGAFAMAAVTAIMSSSRREWARGYVAIAVAQFLFFLPFLVALPVPARWFRDRLFELGKWRPGLWKWFPSW